MEIKQVVLYAQYSPGEHAGLPIEEQVSAMEELCKNRNWEIVGRYIDRGWDATEGQRQSLEQLLSVCGEGKFQAVVVNERDRFGQDILVRAIALHILHHFGVGLVAAKKNPNDMSDPVLIETMLEGMVEFYAENLRREKEKDGARGSSDKPRRANGMPDPACQGEEQWADDGHVGRFFRAVEERYQSKYEGRRM